MAERQDTPITQANKNRIVQMLTDLPIDEIKEFKNFTPQEADYILWIISNQRGGKDWEFETNGTIENINTITKFRKISIEYWKVVK